MTNPDSYFDIWHRHNLDPSGVDDSTVIEVAETIVKLEKVIEDKESLVNRLVSELNYRRPWT